jgi:serine/threonine protein kinase
VEGGELFDEILRRQTFTEYHAACFLRQAALGLKHIHDRGYVHRDIKVRIDGLWNASERLLVNELMTF